MKYLVIFMSFLGKYKQILSRRSLALSLIIFIIGVFLVVQPASAQLGWLEDKAVGLLGSLISVYIYLAGRLLLWIISKLIDIAQFNDFINQPAITHAWIIIRDVCNMFFVIFMLVIAISTMLNYQKYHYKALLPKLVAAAILINFSRTIVGLIVDASQIVMMTFVSGFAAAAGGNFVQALQIDKIMAINPAIPPQEGLKMWQLVAAYILGAGIITLSVITVGMMLIMLLVRIIALWILTALSPFAFMGMAFPGISKHTDRWWNEFFKYVTIGPVLAFFLWLALTIVGTMPEGLTKAPAEGGAGLVDVGISAIGGANVLMNYLIAIVLLMAGVYAAKESGAAGGQLGMQAVNWASQKGSAALKGAAAWTAKKPFQAMGAGLGAMGAGLGALDAKYGWREKLYSAVGRIPGFTKFGARKQAEVSVRREAKAEAAAKWVKQSSPEALERLTKMRAWTPAEKAVKKEAERQALASEDYWIRRQKDEEKKWLQSQAKNRGYKKVEDLIAADPNATKAATTTAKSNLQAEAANMLTDFHALGQQTHDRTVPGVASAFLKANPDLINDVAMQQAATTTKNELTIKFAQEHQFKTVVSKLSDSDLMGLRPDQLTDTILKELSAKQRGTLKKVDVLKKVVVAWEMKQGAGEIVKQMNTGKMEVDDLAKEQIEEHELTLEIAKNLKPELFKSLLKLIKKKESFKDTVLAAKANQVRARTATTEPGPFLTRYNDNLRRGMERAVVAGADFKTTYEYEADPARPGEFANMESTNTFIESIRNKDNTEKTELILNIKAEDIGKNDFDNKLALLLAVHLDTTILKGLATRRKNEAEQRTFEAVIKTIKKHPPDMINPEVLSLVESAPLFKHIKP